MTAPDVGEAVELVRHHGADYALVLVGSMTGEVHLASARPREGEPLTYEFLADVLEKMAAAMRARIIPGPVVEGSKLEN